MSRMTAFGAGSTLLMFLLMYAFRLRGIRKRTGIRLSAGEHLNAAGFAFLPAMAVWKAFEPYIHTESGAEVPSPLPVLPWAAQDGCFVPLRIEMAAAAIAFTALAVWLIARETDLPGNGDLLITVVCVWCGIRIVTESFRAEPYMAAVPLPMAVCLCVIGELLCLLVWSIRRGKRTKTAVLTILDWAAVLACETVIVLQDMAILSMGSEIADLAARAGCALLAMVLTLIAGKDSRG